MVDVIVKKRLDGNYFAIDKNSSTLRVAPEAENILHGFINRWNEYSISSKKPLYSLQEDTNNSNLNKTIALSNKRKSSSQSGSSNVNNNKTLKRSNIFSFHPCYKRII